MPRNMNRYITINHTMHAHIVGHAPPTPNLRTATKLGNTKAAIETEIKLKMAVNLAKGLLRITLGTSSTINHTNKQQTIPYSIANPTAPTPAQAHHASPNITALIANVTA
ncbi:hypothetical protein ATCC27039_18940 [Actinomyces naeslundii]|nr:hypothetical protein ATCC27039_18940 [Actinomyces naeslundii]